MNIVRKQHVLFLKPRGKIYEIGLAKFIGTSGFSEGRLQMLQHTHARRAIKRALGNGLRRAVARDRARAP